MGNRKNILIACMPKSGSNFLRVLLTQATSSPWVRLTSGDDYRENEIDFLFIHGAKTPWISHAHVRCSIPTMGMIETFNILPVVTVRDIFDAIASLDDHLLSGKTMPFIVIPRHYNSWNHGKRVDFCIMKYVPWVLSFVTSWNEKNIGKIWINYDAIVSRTGETVNRILERSGYEPLTNAQMSRLVMSAMKRREDINLNIGRRGRGHAVLSEEQKETVVDMMSYYDIDLFHGLGILRRQPPETAYRPDRVASGIVPPVDAEIGMASPPDDPSRAVKDGSTDP